jgi:23S rRNA pseudouridine2605 synthase
MDGRVLINGVRALPGQMVGGDVNISIDGIDIDIATDIEPIKIIALNKPRNVICTRNDPQGRRCIFDLLPPNNGRSWIGVGRLDFNTEGILLFTNNGELAHRLMHPSAELERIYLARAFGKPLTKNDMELIVSQGVNADNRTFQPKLIELMNSTSKHQSYRVILTEGKNREIHQIFESYNIVISRLLRISYGSIELGELKTGEYRYLTHDEVSQISAPL